MLKSRHKVSIHPEITLKSTEAMLHIRKIVHNNLSELSEEMAERAKDLAPYRTGNLRSSIQAEPEAELFFKVSTSTGYGAYVELGTSKMDAQPFFKPAFDLASRHLAQRPKQDWE